jgi:hypothetical protein
MSIIFYFKYTRKIHYLKEAIKGVLLEKTPLLKKNI